MIEQKLKRNLKPLVISVVLLVVALLAYMLLMLNTQKQHANGAIQEIIIEGGVNDVLFTLDGKFLATYDGTQKVSLYSIKNGRITRQLKAGANIDAIALHPSQPWIAAGASDGFVWLWDYQTGQELNRFTAPADNLGTISFSPNGEYLAAGTRSEDDLLYVWQLDDFALIQEINGHNTSYGLAFSHDNKYLISTNPFTIWNIEDGTLVKQLARDSALWSIHVSQNAPYSVLNDYGKKEVYLWDQQTDKFAVFAKRSNAVCASAISNDGQFVASAPCLPLFDEHSPGQFNTLEQSIQIWNRVDGRLVQEIMLPIQDTHILRFSPDGSMIAAVNSLYGYITVWRVAPNTAAP